MEVGEGATLLFTATVLPSLNSLDYIIKWTVDDDTYGDVTNVYTEGLTNTLTGIAAGTVTVTAEVMDVVYVGGSRTYVSFDTPITDSVEITVNAA